MSRTLKSRKNRPDSVRMPSVPRLSKHPIMMARSSSAGPHASANAKPFTLHKAVSITTPSTPTGNKKILEKIPSISAKSDSSEEEEDEDTYEEKDKCDGTAALLAKHTINSDDDDDDEDGTYPKRTSVIAHEFPNHTDWSPCGSGVSGGIGNGHPHAKNISTKMASGFRVCKATGRSLIRMLSTSSSVNVKSSCNVSHKAVVDVDNNDNNYHMLSKVKFYYPFYNIHMILQSLVRFHLFRLSGAVDQ